MPGGTSATSNTAHRRKKCIFFTGRVHPGETQASWMMKGILDFLTGTALSTVQHFTVKFSVHCVVGCHDG